MSAAGRLALITVLATACATGSYVTSSGSTTTLMAGWERHFALEWTVEVEQDGTRRLRGYVQNQHGEAVEQVRVLARALDAPGAVVGQRINWVPGTVGGFGRAYFEVPNLPPADSYMLTVWDYTLVQSSSGGWN
jgi:hypothetical protein